MEDCGIVAQEARLRRVICLFTTSSIQIMSMSVQTQSYSGFYARLNDFHDYSPNCVAGAKSNGDLAFGVGSFYLRRLVSGVWAARANDFKAGRQATGFRSFANGYSNGFTNRLFMRARRVACFASTRTGIANERVRVQAWVTPRFRRGYLTRARGFDVTLSA